MLGILTNIHKQWLVRRGKTFTLQKGILYRMGQDNRFRHYATIDEAHTIVWELHEGIGGGHFVMDITTKKILDARY
jgi:phenolic acid decarboxylase